jgi:ribosomal-protein-alanine N-acetyltransferase
MIANNKRKKLMHYHFVPMTEEYARIIVAQWQYGGEYAFHDYANEAEHILDTSGWGKSVFAALNENDELVGELTTEFFDEHDEYVEYEDFDVAHLSSAEMWVGFGLKPELTGGGRGAHFVSACLEFALRKHNYQGEYVKLGVPVFNQRAIKVYQRLGFEEFKRETGEMDGRPFEAVQMKKLTRTCRCLLLDWGDTLMRVFPECEGPMFEWPRVAALPYTAATLAQLHPHWQMAVATNAAASQENEIRQALERVGLDQWLDKIYCYRKIGYQKPSPEFFTYILDDLKLSPQAAMLVGDDFDADVLGANRCGIRTIWLNERGAENREGALYRTIHSFLELPQALYFT